MGTPRKKVLLFLQGDRSLRQSLKELLESEGYDVVLDPSDAVQGKAIDFIIISSGPDGSRACVEKAQEIRRRDKKVPIILIAANSCEELAIASLRAGVNDYLRQPFSPHELLGRIKCCLSDPLYREDPAGRETAARDLTHAPRMIGDSQAMRSIRAYIGRVAATDCNVLITGETGTGKELVAGLIHRASPRHEKPLVCINCAAIPDSLLESELFGYEKGAFTGADSARKGMLQLADNGTVFLDEIGEMTPYAQAKLLRVIESQEARPLGGVRSISLDIKVIAATNQELERLVSENRFRRDLYFRLNVARIHLPPLRERKEDLPELLDHYIRELSCRFQLEVRGFTEEVLQCLVRHDWPGNVRELKNLLQAIFIDRPGPRIGFENLPEFLRKWAQGANHTVLGERERLLATLFSTNWNVSKAAQTLHWSRMTIYRKMSKYHIIRSVPAADGLATALDSRLKV
jgi:DNA-binding NtrC family response regulator